MYHRLSFVFAALLLLVPQFARADADQAIEWAGTYAVTTVYQDGPGHLCGGGSNFTLVMQDSSQGLLYGPDNTVLNFWCLPTADHDVVRCVSAARYSLYSAELQVVLRSNNVAVAGTSVVHATVLHFGKAVQCTYAVVGYRVPA